MPGKFFTFSAKAIETIAAQTKFVDAVLGYLVLRKSSQGGKDTCTGGAPSIVKGLGVTRYKADEIIKLLRAVKCGDRPEECVIVTPEVWNKATGDKVPEVIRQYPAKVLPSYGEDQIAVPNTLVEGLKGHEIDSPFRRLRQIEPKEDRLDAVRLLLTLYQHHSFLDYGGVDPKVIRRDWLDNGPLSAWYQEYFSRQVELGYVGQQQMGAGILRYWLAQTQAAYQADPTLLQHIGGTTERLWKLFGDLQGLDLIYEVATVFDEDPVTHPSAEPCYPLYIFDRHAREEEASYGLDGLALALQDHADKSGFLEAQRLDNLPAAIHLSTKEAGSGLFLFSGTTETAKLMNILRLRHRPHTEDVGAGIDAERGRVEEWKRIFATGVETPVSV